MSVYIDTKPSNYGRAFDLNSLYYKIHSDQYTQPNFTFLIELYWVDRSTGSALYNFIGRKKMYPINQGYCWVNPSDLFSTVLSPANQQYDFDPAASGVTEAKNSFKEYYINFIEQFGTPPLAYGIQSDTLYLFNGCQQFISYDSAFGGGNAQWLMITGTTGPNGQGTGLFLTDTNYVYLDDDDYYFIYFINPPSSRINKVTYLINYNSGIVPDPGPGPGGDPIDGPIHNQSVIIDDPNNIQTDGPMGPYVPPVAGVYTINMTGFTLPTASQMFYIPVGMATLKKLYPTIPTGWTYMTVNIYDTNGQIGALNATPFTVRKTCRDRRYTPYQVAWLNNHGGYDFFTFDKGAIIKEKEKRDTFTQDLQPGYRFNQSGVVVYNNNPDEELTLTTSLIENQSQSQILVGLFHSLQAFFIQTYYQCGIRYPNPCISTPIAVPYQVIDTDMPYLNVKTDMEFPVSVTLSPGNKRVVQSL